MQKIEDDKKNEGSSEPEIKQQTNSNSETRTRVTKKLEGTRIHQTVSGWHRSRAFTPNDLLISDEGKESKLLTSAVDDKDEGRTTIITYKKANNSQVLVRSSDRTLGGTVTTSIRTTTSRKKEKKSTYIQYDKTRVDTKNKSFTIKVENYRKFVNYQGGHIIDYKYGAGNSHISEANYIPMHYFYNSPLKEHLVHKAAEYIEILLYANHSPRIGVVGMGNNYHDIPVGIIFVQLNNKKIEDAYFFPNNDYDYEQLKKNLHINKGFAKKIAPHFKLKKALHRLLEPAYLINIGNQENRISEQELNEDTAHDLIDDISEGMLSTDCSDEEEIISSIGFDVVHKREVDISDFLDVDEGVLNEIHQNAGYDICLLFLSEDQKYTIEELQEISKKHKNTPVLIKQRDEYRIFGNKDAAGWDNTTLDKTECQQLALPFPKLGDIVLLKHGNTYKKLYDQISLKKAHIQNVLQIPFNELGLFLINYGLKNALKSEVISIASRLMFIDVIVDFIDAYTQVDEEALELVEKNMAAPFKKSLKELISIKDKMSFCGGILDEGFNYK